MTVSMGYSKSGLRKKFIEIQACVKKQEKSEVKDFTPKENRKRRTDEAQS